MTTTVETNKKIFREYPKEGKVKDFYLKNHENQTYDFVMEKKKEILNLGKWKLNIFDVIRLLDDIIDPSDPDTQSPQIIHSLQTGESCRKKYPENDWFHLLGFIHDLGKVLAHPKMHNLPHWCTTGDTFPVGCRFDESNVYPKFFSLNKDYTNPKFNTMCGIYKENCGFDQLQMSWGHDEYLYQVLVLNQCKLPYEALYVIRYHSFYPWHQRGGYEHFASEEDHNLLPYLKAFQKCDLYSKVEEEIDVSKLLPYYEGLIKKYFDSPVLLW